MSTPTASISVNCFEISQIPADKTDYKFMIQGKVPYQEQVEQWLDALQVALAKPMPETEAILWCRVPSSPDDNVLVCLCRATRILGEGARDYLRFQAAIAPLSEFVQPRVDPISLYFSSIWDELNTLRMNTLQTANFVVQVEGLPNSSQSPDPLATDIHQRLVAGQGGSSPLPRMQLGKALEAVRYATSQMSYNQLARSIITIGVPEQCQLPMIATLVIHTLAPPSHPVSATSYATSHEAKRFSKRNARLRDAAENYRNLLQPLAEQFAKTPLQDSLWPNRLWNRCQDVLTVVEAVENPGPGDLEPRLRLAQTTTDLLREMDRSNIGGDPRQCDYIEQYYEPLAKILRRRAFFQNLFLWAALGFAIFTAAWFMLKVARTQGGEFPSAKSILLPSHGKRPASAPR